MTVTNGVTKHLREMSTTIIIMVVIVDRIIQQLLFVCVCVNSLCHSLLLCVIASKSRLSC